MTTTNTMLSPELDSVKDNWEFSEVWIDPALSPPYLLLLLGASDGRCHVYDPAEGYRLIFESDNMMRPSFGCWRMNTNPWKEDLKLRS